MEHRVSGSHDAAAADGRGTRGKVGGVAVGHENGKTGLNQLVKKDLKSHIKESRLCKADRRRTSMGS